MRILIWHVHGGYTDALVRGDHEYLIPVNDARDEWGRGRAGRDWPATREVELERLRPRDVDLAVLQRPEEIELLARATGGAPGRDIPALYLEHSTPRPGATAMRHLLAGRDDIPLVHVTHFNRLFWDSGDAPTFVVEHGIPDPGYRYIGRLRRIGVVVNEAVRRWRVTGTDLLPQFSRHAPIDVFGAGGEGLPHVLGVPSDRVSPQGDVPPEELRTRLAERRLYLHPFRWTSLGLALLEAMHLGMPVTGLATTETVRAVPPETGHLSTEPEDLAVTIRRFLDDPDAARECGLAARSYALEHYGLDTFLRNWDGVFEDVASTIVPRRGVFPFHHGTRSAL